MLYFWRGCRGNLTLITVGVKGLMRFLIWSTKTALPYPARTEALSRSIARIGKKIITHYSKTFLRPTRLALCNWCDKVSVSPKTVFFGIFVSSAHDRLLRLSPICGYASRKIPFRNVRPPNLVLPVTRFPAEFAWLLRKRTAAAAMREGAVYRAVQAPPLAFWAAILTLWKHPMLSKAKGRVSGTARSFAVCRARSIHGNLLWVVSRSGLLALWSCLLPNQFVRLLLISLLVMKTTGTSLETPRGIRQDKTTLLERRVNDDEHERILPNILRFSSN